MDTGVVQKIGDIFEKNEAIDIVIGKNPRLDEMAAALSLYLSLSASGKKVSIASPSVPTVEISSLVGINKVQTSLSFSKQGSDLIVSFPYKDKEIQKVSYTLDAGYLNIVVKAGSSGLSFSDKDVIFKREGARETGGSVLIVIGTARLSDLGNLFDPEALKDTTVINIDNKQHNQGFGDIIFVSSKYSSVSEQVGYLLKSLNLQIDLDIAQNLLSGISQATDNFQKSTTSSYAFEMAAFLMKKGALRETTGRRDQKQFAQVAKDIHSPFFAAQQRQQPQQRQSFVPKAAPAPFLDEFDEAESLSMSAQTPNSAPLQSSGQATSTQDSSFFRETKIKKDDTSQKSDKSTPSDWLSPKIYKGSSEV